MLKGYYWREGNGKRIRRRSRHFVFDIIIYNKHSILIDKYCDTKGAALDNEEWLLISGTRVFIMFYQFENSFNDLKTIRLIMFLSEFCQDYINIFWWQLIFGGRNLFCFSKFNVIFLLTILSSKWSIFLSLFKAFLYRILYKMSTSDNRKRRIPISIEGTFFFFPEVNQI